MVPRGSKAAGKAGMNLGGKPLSAFYLQCSEGPLGESVDSSSGRWLSSSKSLEGPY